MQRHMIRLKFHAPLHMGTDESLIGIEGAQPTVHSDTVFSGMINVWARLPRRIAPDVGEVIDRFRNGKPPFKISSCFPYHGDTPYLPLPLTFHREHYDPSKRLKYGKSIKKSRFIAHRIFRDWCAEKSALKAIAADQRQMYSTMVVPRVTLDRVTRLSQIFHCGLVYFRQGCGLYFLLEVEDDQWLGYVELVLKLLGECGIGGERSTGCGRFTHELRDIEESNWRDIFSGSGETNAYCVLSLYYPLECERGMFERGVEDLAYQIISRRGWTYSSVVSQRPKRQSCNMLGEGSVVPKAPIGGLVKVTPCGFSGHEVYRYGYAMSVPIKVPGSTESEGGHG